MQGSTHRPDKILYKNNMDILGFILIAINFIYKLRPIKSVVFAFKLAYWKN